MKREKKYISLEKIKVKEKQKFSDLKFNLEQIEINNEIKKEKFFEKLKTLQSRPKDSFGKRIEEYKMKRLKSLEKVKNNSEKINNIIEKKNYEVLKNYQGKNKYSVLKTKSVDYSKINLR